MLAINPMLGLTIYFILGRYSCLILGWQFISHILKSFGIIDLPYKDSKREIIDEFDPLVFKTRAITMGIFFSILLPLCLFRSLGGYRYFTVLLLAIILFSLGVCVFQTPEYYEAYKYNSDYVFEIFDTTPSFIWVQGMMTMMFSFGNHVTLIYVRGELKHKTVSRINAVIRGCMILVLTMYIFMCYAGYISLGKNLLPQTYTLRRKISKKYLIFRSK